MPVAVAAGAAGGAVALPMAPAPRRSVLTGRKAVVVTVVFVLGWLLADRVVLPLLAGVAPALVLRLAFTAPQALVYGTRFGVIVILLVLTRPLWR